MNIKKHIPNMLTAGNLLSGVMAIVFTLYAGRPDIAMWLIVLSAVFDFFDGMVARLLGVSSPIGKDLDSLADVVSFGLAPATLVFRGLEGLDAGNYLNYGVFIVVAFAALRLAKFNNDTRQSTSFLGLPVPSNALFWIGAAAAIPSFGLSIGASATLITYLVLTLVLSLLMVSELPMFSFKLSEGAPESQVASAGAHRGGYRVGSVAGLVRLQCDDHRLPPAVTPSSAEGREGLSGVLWHAL